MLTRLPYLLCRCAFHVWQDWLRLSLPDLPLLLNHVGVIHFCCRAGRGRCCRGVGRQPWAEIQGQICGDCLWLVIIRLVLNIGLPQHSAGLMSKVETRIGNVKCIGSLLLAVVLEGNLLV